MSSSICAAKNQIVSDRGLWGQVSSNFKQYVPGIKFGLYWVLYINVCFPFQIIDCQNYIEVVIPVYDNLTHSSDIFEFTN